MPSTTPWRQGCSCSPPRAVDCAHELLREAVYRAIPLGRGGSCTPRAARWATGDRRLAHRASAADRPDPQLAGDLVAAADTARAEPAVRPGRHPTAAGAIGLRDTPTSATTCCWRR